ncbi:MAG: S41 family peptidase [Holophagaceae bacterium]
MRLAFALATLSLALVAGAPRVVSTPDIHGDAVVFSYDGDLWLGSLSGGAPRRITSHPGAETYPRFSPDGKWIAFNGTYDGGSNIYVIPASGGTPRRLTWRPGATVQGWSPDASRVLFRAAWEASERAVTRLYTVHLEGHEPEALPVPRGVQGAFMGDTQHLLYSPRGHVYNPYGPEEYYWKRYKGGMHQEIWKLEPGAQAPAQLTDYVGKNAYPMWAGGQVLFVSDRGPKGIANLYAMDAEGRNPRALTDFQDFDVQWPATDGRRVVFVQGGRLHVYDLQARTERALDLDLATDDWRVRPRTVNPKDWIQGMALGPGGESVALEARGDVFVVPVDASKPALDLTRTPGVRERFPQLSPDGTRVAYLSDESGEYDLYVRPAAGGPAQRLATGLKTTLYHLEWSPDGKKLLFGDKSFALYVMDVETRRLSKLDESHELKNDQFFWEVSDYTWSPDSQWVAYSFVQPNRNNRIFLFHLPTGRKVALTDGFFDCLNPSFDADGSTLYFLSYSNFHIQLDPSQDHHIEPTPTQVMAVKLKQGDAAGPFRVDVEGLAERIAPLPVKPGNYFHLRAGKGLVSWASAEGWDDGLNEQVFRARTQDSWKLHLYDPAAKKLTVLADTVSDWRWSPEGAHLLIRKQGAFHVGEAKALLGSGQLPARLDLERLSLTVSPREEWTQIFNDTWRWYRDFFYDADMHGQDWQAIGDKFRAFLPQLNTRYELNWLLSQMVGELSVSHTYVGGGDFTHGIAPPPAPTPVFTGLLGADLAADASGRYRFTRVYGPTPYDRDAKGPLADPDPKVKEGEYLLAIDGQDLKAPDAVARRLQVVKGQKVKLTVNARPGLEGARTVEVEPVASDTRLRYVRWVADRIALVERRSRGQLGYMHITAMGDENVGEFDKYWRAFRYRKGLVVDVRGNGGGWTEFFMIDQLERRQVGFNVLRGMAPFRYPGTASDGRYVFVSNELNGSDGEAFLAHVKARGLGTIVGIPSWGGLVGIINTQFTVDGGTVEQSNNAFYGKEGRWWVENHGVDPDVLVDPDQTPEAVLQGRDPMLETAVDTLLKQLQEKPTEAFPPVPAYPKR